MPRESVDTLRTAIVADTEELRVLKGRREELRRLASELGREERKVTARRARRIKRARAAGATTEELAADSKLSVTRIRQLAPVGRKGRPRKTPAVELSAPPSGFPGPVDLSAAHHIAEAVEGRPSPAAALVDHVTAAGPFARTAEQRARVEQLDAATVLVQDAKLKTDEIKGIAAATREIIGGTASTGLPPDATIETLAQELLDDDQDDERQDDRKAPAITRRLDVARGVAGIQEHVREVLIAAGGDVIAARDHLKRHAIDDAMRLLDSCRAGATYDYTAHPSIPAPLKRPGRKQADQIWEGRPRFTNPDTPEGWTIDALDMNGAYLSALRRTHLPIGRLVEDPPGTPFNPRRSGIYLIEPIRWSYPRLPNPMGDGREETGPVWISGATMRLLHRAAKLGYGTAPEVIESHTSGSSENILTKFGDMLAAARSLALDEQSAVMLDYVKDIYARFVSTAGDSRHNHEVFRPDWVHEIRSQAYANLWYKAEKAYGLGVLVHRMMGTDELHLSASWRRINGAPLWPIGRHLSQVKIKDSYVTGDDRA